MRRDLETFMAAGLDGARQAPIEGDRGAKVSHPILRTEVVAALLASVDGRVQRDSSRLGIDPRDALTKGCEEWVHMEAVGSEVDLELAGKDSGGLESPDE